MSLFFGQLDVLQQGHLSWNYRRQHFVFGEFGHDASSVHVEVEHGVPPIALAGVNVIPKKDTFGFCMEFAHALYCMEFVWKFLCGIRVDFAHAQNLCKFRTP